MLRVFVLLLRLACCLALAAVVVGIASLGLLSALGVCPRMDAGAVQCTAPVYEEVAKLGMGILIVTVFTGIPVLFTFGGLIFLIVDGVRFWPRRRRPTVTAG